MKDSEQLLIDRIIDSKINIPPQPAILLEIERMVNSPNDNIKKIGQLISSDAGMTAAIFKLANSSFYKSGGKIASIPKAISIVGLSQIANLIKAMALKMALGGSETAYEKFWKHSEEVAILSSIIAGKQVSVCNIAADQAYMAGMFHDCGVPILMQKFPEYCQVFRLGSGEWPDFEEEDKRFNTNHTVVGYLVAKHWKLPDFICSAIRFHHERLSVEDEALTMVSILQLAQHIHSKLYHARDDEWPEMADKVLMEVGIPEEGASEFIEEVMDIFNHH